MRFQQASAVSLVLGAASSVLGNPLTDRALAKRDWPDAAEAIKIHCEFAFYSSTIINQTIYMDGGYFSYNNGTKHVGPNMWLRTLDTSVGFSLLSRPELPLKFHPRPPGAIEVSGGVLWPNTRTNALVQAHGYHENADRRYPGFSPYSPNFLNEVWQFAIDERRGEEGGTWKQISVHTEDVQGRKVDKLTHAQYAWDEENGIGYAVGGDLANQGRRAPPRIMQRYEIATNEWSTSATPFAWWARGTAVFVPLGKGLGGMMVAFAGAGEGVADGSMDTIHVMRVPPVVGDEKVVPQPTWHSQRAATAEAIGFPGKRLLPCSTYTVAPDGTSINIYLYGGVVDGSPSNGPTDVWVLSLPSFTWIRVAGASARGNPGIREGMTCHTVGNGKRTMMFVGGRVLPDHSRACDATGIFAFDMVNMQWLDRYDPDTDDYEVPQAIYKVVGGDAKGGAKLLEPEAGWADDKLKDMFAGYLKSVLPEEKDEGEEEGGEKTPGENPGGGNNNDGGAGGSDGNTAQPDGEGAGEGSSSSSSLSGGAIAGIALGAVGVILLVVAAIIFFRRRRASTAAAAAAASPAGGYASNPTYELPPDAPRAELPHGPPEPKPVEMAANREYYAKAPEVGTMPGSPPPISDVGSGYTSDNNGAYYDQNLAGYQQGTYDGTQEGYQNGGYEGQYQGGYDAQSPQQYQAHNMDGRHEGQRF